jgi:hypothetical protein
MRITFTDQQGHWSVAGLPPGDYFAVAGPMVHEGDLTRRDRLAALQAVGTPFRIDAEGARTTVALKVTPVPASAVR